MTMSKMINIFRDQENTYYINKGNQWSKYTIETFNLRDI